MGIKRPDNIKLEVVKAPSGIRFADSVGRADSVYQRKLSEALATDSTIKINAADAYMRVQLRKAAEKLRLRLVYGIEGEFMYVKPIAVDGELKRLMLLLREARTVNELEGAKLELHLGKSLERLDKDKLAHSLTKGGATRWVLTEKGFDTLGEGSAK